MPLDRSRRLADQSVVMAGPDDIASLFDALRRLPQRSFFTQDRARRDIAEELGYQLLLRPEWIRAHVAELVREGIGAVLDFPDLCVLLEAADEGLLSELVDAANDGKGPDPVTLLLASRHPLAMDTVTRIAAENETVARTCRAFGFDAPRGGPLEPRFTIVRRALRIRPGTEARGAAHAIGLPIADVAARSETRIAFHYFSVTPERIGGFPGWPGQVHAVAPRHAPDWTLTARSGDDGRLAVLEILLGDDRSLDEELAQLDEAGGEHQASAAVEVVPFDDELLYANQHPLLTPNVFGVAGGPPMGLAPAPVCPDCGRVMFHVAWADPDVRRYGDGFRSSFLCEDCQTSATLATMWN